MVGAVRIEKSQRLLNPHANVANQDITYKNASDSPLLRLPPELRNRIFEYVIGGNLLHVWVNRRSSYRLQHSICNIGENDDYDYQRCSKGNFETPFERRHNLAGCVGLYFVRSLGLKRNRLSVSLLRACRQIRGEAGLLLYAMNTFSFPETSDFEKFVKSLAPIQQRAIRKIIVIGVGDFGLQAPTTISKLVNLTEFIYHGLATPSYPEKMISDRLLKRMERLPLLKVMICAEVLRLDADELNLNILMIEAQTEQIEKRLLQGTHVGKTTKAPTENKAFS